MKKLCLLFLTLFLIVTLLASCVDEGETSSPVSTANSSDEASQSETSEPDSYKSGLPDELDYGGATFTILSSYTHGLSPSMNTFFGGNGDYESNVVNDAALLRNTVVEENLGISIVEMVHADTNAGGTGSFQEYVTTTVNGGLCEYQMMQGSLYNCRLIATNGNFEDLSKMKYIDLDAEWWNKTFIDDTSFGDTVYYAVGDISFGHMNCIYFVIFNKEIQSSFELDDFYAMVNNGTWTYDVMFENSKKVLDDVDSNGSYGLGDQIGSCGQSSVMWASYYACGGRITTKDAEGYPELTFDTEDSINVLTKMSEFFSNTSNYLILGDDDSIEQIRTDKTLFFDYHTGGIKGLSVVESDIGFLPHPKYSVDQESYYSLISPWGGQAIGVPYGYDDETLDYISAVMEEMAVQGKNYLTDAFCETMCKYQKTRDDESMAMLDIIFATSGCDLGLIYRFGTYNAQLQYFAERTNMDIVSTIDSFKTQAETEIDQYIETIDALRDSR